MGFAQMLGRGHLNTSLRSHRASAILNIPLNSLAPCLYSYSKYLSKVYFSFLQLDIDRSTYSVVCYIVTHGPFEIALSLSLIEPATLQNFILFYLTKAYQ